MSLKLFRATGHSTLLLPGEARLAPRPGAAVLAVSAWVAFACNVALWRAASEMDLLAVARALAQGLVWAGVLSALLSLLCWRRTFKPVASALLVLAAASAASVWLHDLPTDSLRPIPERVFPGWAALMDWRVGTWLMIMGLAPVLLLWGTQLRRMTGPAQWRDNLRGLSLGALILAGGVLARLQASGG